MSIAGPFDHPTRAGQWLSKRKLDGSLKRMLPIPPADLMRRSPTELADGNGKVPAGPIR